MRDLIGLVQEEAALVVAALERLEQLAAAGGGHLGMELARVKMELAAWVASRVEGRAGATTRPAGATEVHTAGEELITTEEAARMLGVSSDAVRKSCRAGRWAGAARKVRGAWLIEAEAVEAAAGGAA